MRVHKSEEDGVRLGNRTGADGPYDRPTLCEGTPALESSRKLIQHGARRKNGQGAPGSQPQVCVPEALDDQRDIPFIGESGCDHEGPAAHGGRGVCQCSLDEI